VNNFFFLTPREEFWIRIRDSGWLKQAPFVHVLLVHGRRWRLCDKVWGLGASQQIFMDIDAIALGEDFVEAIETTVASERLDGHRGNRTETPNRLQPQVDERSQNRFCLCS
jgi:hypothetical protein